MRTYRKVFGFLLLALALTACTTNVQPTNSQTPTNHDAVIYFVADTPIGFRLFPETHLIEVDGNQALSVLQAIVDEGLQPRDPEYANFWTYANTKVLSFVVTENTATIDLDYGRLNVGAEAEMRALDQLMYSVHDLVNNVKTFQFTVNGEKIESLAGHVGLSNPIKLGSTYEVLSNVWINTPQHDQLITGNLIASGMACTFEANVSYQLMKNKTLIVRGSTTALEACPTRSPWKIDFGKLAKGNYTLKVFERSAKNGTLLAVDSKDFLVG